MLTAVTNRILLARTAGAAVAVPVYLLSLWALHVMLSTDLPAGAGLTPMAVLLILHTPWTGHAVLLTGLLVAGLVAAKLVRRPKVP